MKLLLPFWCSLMPLPRESILKCDTYRIRWGRKMGKLRKTTSLSCCLFEGGRLMHYFRGVDSSSSLFSPRRWAYYFWSEDVISRGVRGILFVKVPRNSRSFLERNFIFYLETLASSIFQSFPSLHNFKKQKEWESNQMLIIFSVAIILHNFILGPTRPNPSSSPTTKRKTELYKTSFALILFILNLFRGDKFGSRVTE